MKGCSSCCISCGRIYRFFLPAMLMIGASVLTPFMLICQADTPGPDMDVAIDFTMLSLEELKDVEIISASKKLEKITEADTAVFVITQEDIRRSGATTIPDALRLAPGVEVARINTNSWAVSIRGFNDYYANKLLVLIDGRSVYSPVFSGVFWDVQDTLLEDIERIEVIRGPGSVLWGANAVNGVINIITKKAKDTQGWLFNGGGGTEEQGFGSIRYGDVLNENAHYRMYAKYFNRDQLDDTLEDRLSSRHDRFDVFSVDMSTESWEGLRGGFRIDWESDQTTSFSLQGEAYANENDIEEESIFSDNAFEEDDEETSSRMEGGHVLGRWHRRISETSDTVFQMYYDRTKRDSLEAKYAVNTFDFDFQHRFATDKRHELTWGLGYRFVSDEIDGFYFNSYSLLFDPESRDQYLFSAFVQDEIQVVEDRVRVTIGSKFEHNDFTGFEVQPGIRFLWTPKENHSVWGAVSRAVRAPARSDSDGRFGFQIGPEGVIIDSESGSDQFDSEEVIAYEVGYRLQPTERVWLDMTGFYNRYKGLKTSEEYPYDPSEDDKGWLGFILEDYHIQSIKTSYLENKMEGHTYGFELAADWQAADNWHVKTAYSYLETRMCLTDNSTDTKTKSKTEGSSPRHQFSVRSFLDITKTLEFDLWLRYVGELPARQTGSYSTLDARVGWKIFENVDLSIVGQNLLDCRHPEFSVPEVERSGYCKLTWRF